MIARDYALWRTIVFPFYSRREVLFILSVVGMVTLAVWAIDPFAPLYRYSIATYVGGALMGHFASPARTICSAEKRDRIVQLLQYNGLTYDSDESAWFPPLPRSLLYPHTRIVIEEYQDDIMISGPYGFLVKLLKQLNSI